MNILFAVQGAISQGLLWGIMALGVYITFRVLDYADMSCDGTFALGGCVSAVLVVNYNWNSYLSLFVAIILGALAGTITGLLHTKGKIPAILSGILTMTGLYSINLRIMGQANTSLIGTETIFSQIKNLFPETFVSSIRNFTTWIAILIGFIFMLIVVMLLYWFFGTEIGCAIRATGNNEDMVRALGENTDKTKILGLLLGNALVSLSGALVSQSQGYADVGMGIGAIVTGLASIVIGEVIMAKARTFKFRLISIILGSIIYRIIIAIVLQLGLDTDDLKLLTAVVVTIALIVPNFIKKKAALKQ